MPSTALIIRFGVLLEAAEWFVQRVINLRLYTCVMAIWHTIQAEIGSFLRHVRTPERTSLRFPSFCYLVSYRKLKCNIKTVFKGCGKGAVLPRSVCCVLLNLKMFLFLS